MTIEEILKDAGFEVNKSTPKYLRAKGVSVNAEILNHLLELLKDENIVKGTIDIGSSQVFLYYGDAKPTPEPEKVIKEPPKEAEEESVEDTPESE